MLPVEVILLFNQKFHQEQRVSLRQRLLHLASARERPARLGVLLLLSTLFVGKSIKRFPLYLPPALLSGAAARTDQLAAPALRRLEPALPPASAIGCQAVTSRAEMCEQLWYAMLPYHVEKQRPSYEPTWLYLLQVNEPAAPLPLPRGYVVDLEMGDGLLLLKRE